MACRLVHERLAGCESVPTFGVGFQGKSIVPQSAGPDHDQRLKVLLKDFFEAFFLEVYAELDQAQKERLQALLHTEAYQEVDPSNRVSC